MNERQFKAKKVFSSLIVNEVINARVMIVSGNATIDSLLTEGLMQDVLDSDIILTTNGELLKSRWTAI